MVKTFHISLPTSPAIPCVSPPKVTIVIPVWNSGAWLPRCLARLSQQTFQDFETILVDNGSTDGSVDLARHNNPRLKIIAFETNQGFAAAVNAGIRQTRSEYIALLNVDTRPDPDWLEQLVCALDRSPVEVGSVSSKMLVLEDPDLIDDAGDTLSWYGSARKRGYQTPAVHYNELEEVFSACAGAALYRRVFFETVGLFDEEYTSYFEDVDLGLRGRLYGYRCLYVPEAQVLHQGHSTGVVGGRYVSLMTCNRLMTFLKNVPLRLLLKHGYHLLFGQFYFFLVYKKPWDSLKGYGRCLLKMPHIIRQRQRILPARAIPLEALDNLLSLELGEPALRDIIRHKLF